MSGYPGKLFLMSYNENMINGDSIEDVTSRWKRSLERGVTFGK